MAKGTVQWRITVAGPPPSSSPPRRRRQERTVYSEGQQQALESHFQGNKYPTYQEREALAARLSLQEHQVQVWFKNRRAKESRLRQPPRRRGQGARAASRGPGAPAPAPPGPPLPEGPGFCSPPPPSAAGVFPAAEPSVYSPGQAWWMPVQGAQDVVPAAPALASAPAPAWPRNSYASDFPQDPIVLPDFTAFLSPQDPLEGPSSSSTSGYQEEDDSADENDSGPGRLQDL
ncbi:tetrapeptide repeat homeobox protein 2 [Diceros bicornis minor]|uniref:tetrapeptide repeat homeobox protein 2 n=1 Tax=Diceros bicornis minor TaxID=77932 RepID=UPI0026ED8055|nr:tetrapeptide repeat homeobox protein 2 [Diceros bicornis minor]